MFGTAFPWRMVRWSWRWCYLQLSRFWWVSQSRVFARVTAVDCPKQTCKLQCTSPQNEKILRMYRTSSLWNSSRGRLLYWALSSELLIALQLNNVVLLFVIQINLFHLKRLNKYVQYVYSSSSLIERLKESANSAAHSNIIAGFSSHTCSSTAFQSHLPKQTWLGKMWN